MPTRRKPTPSFAASTAPQAAPTMAAVPPPRSVPRQLPDEDDPARQPMPERNPLDPPPNPAPDAPPNGDHDSGPLTDTPASRLAALNERLDQPLPTADNGALGPSDPNSSDLWHDSPPRDPDEDDDPDAPPDDPEDDEAFDPLPAEKHPPEYEDLPETPAPPAAISPAEMPAHAAFPSPNASPLGGNVRYEARIQILDAFQYPGAMKDAPDWVDRNWIGWADEDQLRGIVAGPCLRVPVQSGEMAVCRIGDFVARQEIRIAPDMPGEIRVEVWPKEQFFKLFMPVAEKVFRPFNPKPSAVIEHEPAVG